jgi:hypothetical protein
LGSIQFFGARGLRFRLDSGQGGQKCIENLHATAYVALNLTTTGSAPIPKSLFWSGAGP